VRTNAIRAGLDFATDYRRQDPAKLANVFKMVSVDVLICKKNGVIYLIYGAYTDT
jgi:hypothetical protein